MPWSAGAILTAAQLNTYAPQAWSSWTPTISASAGTFTTVAANRARYVQHGKTVVWDLTITITTAGTASGYVLFTLPATAASAFGSSIGSGRALVPTTSVVAQAFLNTTSQARVSRYDDTGVIGSGYVIHLFGTYEAA